MASVRRVSKPIGFFVAVIIVLKSCSFALFVYSFTTRSKKAERQFYAVLALREGVRDKLELLREDPRGAVGAHKLKGKLIGKWSCVLGGDIRVVYEIDDEKKELVVVAAGSHKMVYS